MGVAYVRSTGPNEIRLLHRQRDLGLVPRLFTTVLADLSPVPTSTDIALQVGYTHPQSVPCEMMMNCSDLAP